MTGFLTNNIELLGIPFLSTVAEIIKFEIKRKILTFLNQQTTLDI